MRKLTVLTLVSILTVSCLEQWGKGIKGNGNIVSVEQNVGDYDSVAVLGFFDIYLADGEEGQLTLQGEENLLEHIITVVENGKLTIKTEEGINLKPSNWKDGIRLTVPIESIEAVSLSGSGGIIGEKMIKASDFKIAISGSGDINLDFETDTMTAAVSGSGDMNLSGRTKDFETTITGSGNIEAYNLEADNVQATTSGSGDIKVTAREMLKARVSGSGDIGYRGNPKKVDTKTLGSGNILKG